MTQGIVKVSVILPSYNGEKTIHKAIDSYLNQTMKDCELIITDDCSTDGTRKIIEDYTNLYPEKIVRFFSQQNTHGSGVIKQGIKEAKGEYIKILDQDDWMAADMLERLYEAAKCCDIYYDMVDCDIAIADTNGNIIEIKQSNGIEQTGELDNIKRASLLVRPGFCLTKIIRRQFLIDNDIWHFDCCSYEDNYFMELCVAHAKNLAKVNEALYYKMARDGSVTRSFNNPIKYDRLVSSLKIEAEMSNRGFLKEYPDEISARFVELYYLNSVNDFLCTFNPSELNTLKTIRNYIRMNYPQYRKNKYFKNASPRKKLLSKLNDISPTALVILYTLYRRIFLKN